MVVVAVVVVKTSSCSDMAIGIELTHESGSIENSEVSGRGCNRQRIVYKPCPTVKP